MQVLSNEWDEYANKWDLDPAVIEYANKAFKELLEVINIDGLDVFDFGCGTGNLTMLISAKAKEVVALDGSTEMIRILAKKDIVNVSTISSFLTKDIAENHPHFRDKFDVIVASSVCGFLADYEMILGLLKSLLKKNGRFVQWDWLSQDDSSETGMSKSRVLQALETNEFIDIQITEPFEMVSSKGSMKVIMAVAKKA